jgi:hypothetical protein
MAVLLGILPTAAYYTGTNNPYLSADLNQFGVAMWPQHESLETQIAPSTVITSWPVEANAREIAGFVAGSYFDDFYHRIHVIPGRIDLGNVVTEQTMEVNVWNAYFSYQQLLNIGGVVEGLQLTGQSNPPLYYEALQERTYSLGVTTDGPAVLDAVIEFYFSLGGVGRLAVTGNRITAFPWRIDWTNGVREKLMWATDILQSESLAEQCRALRIAPRRALAAELLLHKRERQHFDLALFDWGARVWAIPVWFDVQQLNTTLTAGATVIPCDTVGRDFRVGGLAMLLGETAFQYETVEILSIANNQLVLKRPTLQTWALGTRLYPARTAQFERAPKITRLNDELQKTTVEFAIAEPCDWPAVAPANTYRGYPVYDATPDESDDLTSEFHQLLLTLDSGFGPAALLTNTADLSLPVLLHRWKLFGRAERAAFRSFLYYLNGRQKRAWIPTHADDLTLIATIGSAATTLDVVAIGYTRFGKVKKSRRDIRVQLRNGTVFYRRILGSTEISVDVERLQIDAPFNVLINPADVVRISWLMLMRANSDSVEILHITDGDGVASSEQIFIGVADDV